MIDGGAGVVAAAVVALLASWLTTRIGGMRPIVAIVVAVAIVVGLALVGLAALVMFRST
jgi:hypothetical protein